MVVLGGWVATFQNSSPATTTTTTILKNYNNNFDFAVYINIYIFRFTRFYIHTIPYFSSFPSLTPFIEHTFQKGQTRQKCLYDLPYGKCSFISCVLSSLLVCVYRSMLEEKKSKKSRDFVVDLDERRNRRNKKSPSS